MAQIFAHPNCFATPIVQGRLVGRHPKGITALWQARQARSARGRKARELEELREKLWAAQMVVQLRQSDLLKASAAAAKEVQS